MGWRDALRALIDSEEPDDTEETPNAPEGEEASGEGDAPGEGDVGDESDGDSGAADAAEGDEAATPGTEADDPRIAELQAALGEQAALIETLRNQLAAAGISEMVPEETPPEEEIEEVDEAELVAAFETDYDERAARLAAMRKGL